jgi:hypothetical protein
VGPFLCDPWQHNNIKAELSAEWFGYLKANVSGKYYIIFTATDPILAIFG